MIEELRKRLQQEHKDAAIKAKKCIAEERVLRRSFITYWPFLLVFKVNIFSRLIFFEVRILHCPSVLLPFSTIHMMLTTPIEKILTTT